jgi:hypothetical protein
VSQILAFFIGLLQTAGTRGDGYESPFDSDAGWAIFFGADSYFGNRD